MAVRLHDVLVAVEIEIREEEPKGEIAARGRAEALAERFVGEGRLAERLAHEVGDVERARFVREVADRDREAPVVARPRGVDPHRASRRTVTVIGEARLDRDIPKARRAVGCGAEVPKEELWRLIVRDQDVHETVEVDIDEDKAKRLCIRRAGDWIFHSDAGLGRRVPKATLTVIHEQREHAALETRRRAIRATDAIKREVHASIDRGRPSNIVRNDNVEIAVVIGVEHAR